ncbi:MAG: cupredoxin domain-containing protein [Candidatus Limnocylindrales bacterium]
MTHGKLIAGVTALSLALGVTGIAVAAKGTPPKKATIKVSQKLIMKPNRYIQDGLRWDKDAYNIRSGGTLHIVNTVATEGPHTFTVVKKKDLPRTAAQTVNCKICNTIAAAHGADPQSNGPPKFQYLENGVGQNTPPNVDRPGDSGVTGPGQRGESIDLKVTAKKGTTLYFMCIIHPWMQAKVIVG